MILGSGRRPLQSQEQHDEHDVDSDFDGGESLEEATEDDILEPWMEWIRRTTGKIEEQEQIKRINIQR